MRFTFYGPDFLLQLLLDHNAGDTISRPASIQITDNSGTYVPDSVGVRLKGNSSFDFYPTDKKPLKLDFNEFISGHVYHGLKKLNLANCWSDPTFLREKVFFEICRSEGVLAPRMSFANVYLNDVHWGLYGAIEQVDKTLLDRWLGDNAGNLFKAGDNYTPDGGGLGLEADLKHYGPAAEDYAGRNELKTNEARNDWSDLIGYRQEVRSVRYGRSPSPLRGGEVVGVEVHTFATRPRQAWAITHDHFQQLRSQFPLHTAQQRGRNTGFLLWQGRLRVHSGGASDRAGS